MTGNYSQTGDEKQIIVQGLEKQLKEAREENATLKKKAEEIATLKKKAKEDINELWKKFKEYDSNRKKFESEIGKQASEREERSSTQFGWGQAVNFVPIFSHAYSLATSKANEIAERKESEHRETLVGNTDKVYEELEDLCNEIIKSYD